MAFTLIAGSTVVPVRGASSDFSNPVSRLFTRVEQPLHQYRAYRRMHASSENTKYEAWLEAWTELKDGRFSYNIVNEKGSESVRSRVLRAILAREQEVVNNGEGDKGELTAANYEFVEGGRDSDGAQVVHIKPKRSDVMLVDGRAVLDDRGDLLRVEGRLSKNPSFWTSLVNIVRRYARIGGVRVPVATETTAKVKFVGTAQLEVLYNYQSVNGRSVALTELSPITPLRSAAR
ncbi:MAG TPA: hypothetical protein VNC21_09730 [Vicinamibacterales bacterium]|nr:hypothetical protein [Vicinamibacterales bacterium]